MTNPDLLGALIVEMEEQALERVFRMLQILEAGEEFATIFAALSAGAREARASAREVIGHVLAGPFRDALLAVTDSLPPSERLKTAADAVPVPVAAAALGAWQVWTDDASAQSVADALSPVIDLLLADRSSTLSSIARFQLGARLEIRVPPTETAHVAD